MKWTTLCKRTSDPKLGYIEYVLTEFGIAHKRDGYSFHGPVLLVPEDREDDALYVLGLPARHLDLPVRAGVSLDDVPDDHPCFIAPDYNPRLYDYDSCWALYQPHNFIPECDDTNPCGECEACHEAAMEDPSDYVGMGWIGKDGQP